VVPCTCGRNHPIFMHPGPTARLAVVTTYEGPSLLWWPRPVATFFGRQARWGRWSSSGDPDERPSRRGATSCSRWTRPSNAVRKLVNRGSRAPDELLEPQSRARRRSSPRVIFLLGKRVVAIRRRPSRPEGLPLQVMRRCRRCRRKRPAQGLLRVEQSNRDDRLRDPELHRLREKVMNAQARCSCYANELAAGAPRRARVRHNQRAAHPAGRR